MRLVLFPRSPRSGSSPSAISASLKPTASFLIEDYVAIRPVEVELFSLEQLLVHRENAFLNFKSCIL